MRVSRSSLAFLPGINSFSKGTASTRASQELQLCLQVSHTAWAALAWIMDHNCGHATLRCAKAVLALLHKLLASHLESMRVDISDTFCLGLPVLMRCMAGPTAENVLVQVLLKLLLDRFVVNPELYVNTADDRLWKAMHNLLITMGEKRSVCASRGEMYLQM